MSTDIHSIDMHDLLELVVQEGASDIHLAVGAPPILRIDGELHAIESDDLRPEDTERLMQAIAPEKAQEEHKEKGGSDFGYPFEDKGRFRVSIFWQKGCVGLVARLIPSKLMTLEEIGLPPQVKELLYKPRGLFLVTGPTGSGKTTTLASMLNVINETRDCHIITVEDPIEYYHPHKKSIFTQREVGVDIPDFASAVRSSLRQDPDVILVGEMRDLETMEAAITAAETGHLVFATLHTTGAARTVDRIVDAFPTNQQEMIRIQLSANLIAVLSQLLLVRKDEPGRIAAYEFMVTTPSISSLIRDKKTFRLTSDIQTGARHGMVTLDNFLLNLYEQGVISYEDLIAKCQDVDTVVTKLEGSGKRK